MQIIFKARLTEIATPMVTKKELTVTPIFFPVSLKHRSQVLIEIN